MDTEMIEAVAVIAMYQFGFYAVFAGVGWIVELFRAGTGSD